MTKQIIFQNNDDSAQPPEDTSQCAIVPDYGEEAVQLGLDSCGD